MKLGISYNLFDGEELLEASLKSVREEAFHINVVYQTTSYYGNNSSPYIKDFLLNLKNKGLIDEIFHYERDFSKNDKHYFESEKRNIGLSIARKSGCTHFLSMDVDEFYDREQLKKAKKYIERKRIKTSAVSIIEYLKHPFYKMVDAYTFMPSNSYNFYVPFIMKIHRFWPQKHNRKWYPCLVDPSRALNNREKFYLFSKQDIVMHHMCTVRKNLYNKYANSNLNQGNDCVKSSIRKLQQDILNWQFEDYRIGNTNYSLFNGRIIEKVENQFNIPVF